MARPGAPQVYPNLICTQGWLPALARRARRSTTRSPIARCAWRRWTRPFRSFPAGCRRRPRTVRGRQSRPRDSFASHGPLLLARPPPARAPPAPLLIVRVARSLRRSARAPFTDRSTMKLFPLRFHCGAAFALARPRCGRASCGGSAFCVVNTDWSAQGAWSGARARASTCATRRSTSTSRAPWHAQRRRGARSRATERRDRDPATGNLVAGADWSLAPPVGIVALRFPTSIASILHNHHNDDGGRVELESMELPRAWRCPRAGALPALRFRGRIPRRHARREFTFGVKSGPRERHRRGERRGRAGRAHAAARQRHDRPPPRRGLAWRRAPAGLLVVRARAGAAADERARRDTSPAASSSSTRGFASGSRATSA